MSTTWHRLTDACAHISLPRKILAIGVVLPALIVGMLVWMYSKDAKERAIEASVDKARSICLSAESAREQTEKQWASGIFSHEVLRDWGARGEDDKVLSTVPVVTAWETAMAKAVEGGYQFRVPAMQPRNPKNAADALQREALGRLESEGLDEYHVVNTETNSVHYFRPVKLAASCLNCHGDPAKSNELWGRTDGIDVTGHPMENWELGDMHGAFEVIQSLDKAEEAAANSIMIAIGTALGALAVSGLATIMILRSVTSRINLATVTISKSVRGLRGASQSLERDAANNSSQSVTMSAALTEMTANIGCVSKAMDEIGKSVSEIAAQSTEATITADAAVKEATNTRMVIQRLGESSGQIDSVTQAINSLAAQTNLLALNATIEAARAGESGRGFAVVANEVKELANQTAKATEGITNVIGQVRDDVATAIASVERIHHVISEIHAGQHTVASAVEEQNVMTKEIAHNIQELSVASAEISDRVTSVAHSCETTSGRVQETAELIANIDYISTELPAMIGLRSSVSSAKTAAKSQSSVAANAGPAPQGATTWELAASTAS